MGDGAAVGGGDGDGIDLAEREPLLVGEGLWGGLWAKDA